jgi:hypothetical protein
MASSNHHHSYKLVEPTWSTAYTYVSSTADHKHATPLFVVDISSFKKNKPDLTLHQGPDRKTCPAVACCYILSTSRRSKIGLGDFKDPEKVRWEDLKQETLRSSAFSWGMDLGGGERVELTWKTTRKHAVVGKTLNKWSSRNWKLVSAAGSNVSGESSGEADVICVFTSESGLTTVCGTLQFNVEWGQDFEYMVLLTLAFL